MTDSFYGTGRTAPHIYSLPQISPPILGYMTLSRVPCASPVKDFVAGPA